MAMTTSDDLKWVPPRGKRWSRQDGRALIRALEGRPSGETVADFARRMGVSAERVRWWQARLKQVDGRRPEVAFTPVRVVDGAIDQSPARPSAPKAVEVIVGGCTIRVGEGFDAALLRQVVCALEGQGPC